MQRLKKVGPLQVLMVQDLLLHLTIYLMVLCMMLQTMLSKGLLQVILKMGYKTSNLKQSLQTAKQVQ